VSLVGAQEAHEGGRGAGEQRTKKLKGGGVDEGEDGEEEVVVDEVEKGGHEVVTALLPAPLELPQAASSGDDGSGTAAQAIAKAEEEHEGGDEQLRELEEEGHRQVVRHRPLVLEQPGQISPLGVRRRLLLGGTGASGDLAGARADGLGVLGAREVAALLLLLLLPRGEEHGVRGVVVVVLVTGLVPCRSLRGHVGEEQRLGRQADRGQAKQRGPPSPWHHPPPLERAARRRRPPKGNSRAGAAGGGPMPFAGL
jgi:hypothetical protein